MLRSQHFCQQGVLALEVAVERALGDVGRGSDLVDVDAREPPLAEKPVGCL